MRVQDVRDAYRLIGECRDLGNDPVLWQVWMLEGLRRLVGNPAATGGEGLLVGPERRVVGLSSFSSGLDAQARAVLANYMRDGAVAEDPFVRALTRVSDRLVTRTRRQAVPDAVYYRSAVVDDYLRHADVGHRLMSFHLTAGGRGISVIHLNRAPGERDFSPREQRLLNFFHAELGPLIGRALVSATEPSPGKLAPRLRQTLACLLEGDSEKQVAARLGISHATAHQYVTALYRRFGVHSRGQLVAHVLRRATRAEWQGAVTGHV
ncbi:MAG TPA: helix-turn-helix transcriptional regulator [Chloroflexota bacterium]|nr:helix-turn-helix transcriptional regulator [Chloroflexota bacterium]